MSDNNEIKTNLFLELRRGTITLCVLSQLTEPKYGYALVETLDEKGMRVEPGTLYPLLRRLEKQGLLKSEWETTGSKPRKYYVLSEMGEQVYLALTAEWGQMRETIDTLTNEEAK
ncbi:MAG: PadR family transcriptional regulator [Clostridia bacterium]|jgi:PadR family transcriptional regulator, regulatory protein PadR|nr:PadR family transcriptional regulator [Clostridia bacterium]MBT7122686.1 PadR family transcriptional regulator [Clostridia bacterium]